MNCPVCTSPEIEGNVCKNCETDLTICLRIKELPDYYYNQAIDLIHADKFDEAVEKLMLVLSFAPDYADAYILVGKVYAQQGLYEKAIDYWNRVLTLEIEQPSIKLAVDELIEKVKDILVNQCSKEGYLDTVEGKKLGWWFRTVYAAVIVLLIGGVIAIFLSNKSDLRVKPIADSDMAILQKDLTTYKLAKEGTFNGIERKERLEQNIEDMQRINSGLEIKIDHISEKNKLLNDLKKTLEDKNLSLQSENTILNKENDLLKSRFRSVYQLKKALRVLTEELKREKVLTKREQIKRQRIDDRKATASGNRGYIFYREGILDKP